MENVLPFPVVVGLPDWIDSVRHLLAPPVGNKLLHGEGMHKVMVVGGPNTRSDYHIEIGEELFLQLEGGMTLEVYEHGTPRSIPIPQGSILLLPGSIPHSPQRQAGTVGLVLERERQAREVDGLRWYTTGSTPRVLYEETFACTDLGVQLKPVIERYFASDAAKSGQPARDFEAASPVVIDVKRNAGQARDLLAWATRHAEAGLVTLFGPGAVEGGDDEAHDYKVEAVTGGGRAVQWEAGAWRRVVQRGMASGSSDEVSEVLLYTLSGEGSASLSREGDGEGVQMALGAGSVLLVRPGFKLQAGWQPGSVALIVTHRL